MTTAFVLAQTDHGSMIVNRMDYNVSFNGNFYGVGAQLMENGAYDPQEVETLKQLLNVRRRFHGDGVLALDCGANIGVHALEWSRLMRGWGEVIAIEAQERIFYALAGNLALHNCFNARAIWAALDKIDGTLDIPEPDYTQAASFGSFELKPRLGVENIGQQINYDKPTITVQTIRIDSLQLPRCDFLKIDVEGMEFDVLEGAKETIERCKPMLYVEHIKLDKDRLKALLEGYGYKVMPNSMNFLAVHTSDKSASCIEAHETSRFTGEAA